MPAELVQQVSCTCCCMFCDGALLQSPGTGPASPQPSCVWCVLLTWHEAWVELLHVCRDVCVVIQQQGIALVVVAPGDDGQDLSRHTS